MKIFLTGATGFIGAHLVRRLHETDCELVCLVRQSSDVGDLEACGARIAIGDVTDKASVVAGMRGCDSVFHLANLYSFWEPDPRVYTRVNIDGTRNVMEAVLETGVSKVVHVSSVVTYGRPASLPFAENTPEGPRQFSEYARTKFAGDRLAWRMREEAGLPLVVVYPAAVVGPGDTKASGRYVMNLIHRRIPTRVYDDSILTWVDVRDAVEVIVRAMDRDGNIGERYLACGERLTNREFCRLVCDIGGVNVPRIHQPDILVRFNAALLTALAGVTRRPPPWGMSVDQMRTLREGIEADGGKAQRELGIAYTPIRTALQQTIAQYRQSGPVD